MYFTDNNVGTLITGRLTEHLLNSYTVNGFLIDVGCSEANVY